MRRRTHRVLSVALCLAVAGLIPMAVSVDSAGAVPSGFTDSPVAGGIAQPMDIDWTPDGRALVPTKSGLIRVIQNGALLSTPALNLSGIVCTDVERGMGGVAVHPQFATNRYIYVYYTFPKFG